MLRGLRLLAVIAVLAGSVPVQSAGVRMAGYPETRRDEIADTIFGERIEDPYRWLEADVRADGAVGAWVAQQNALSSGHFASLPTRQWFEERLRRLFDHERFGLPLKARDRYFYTRNAGLLNQPQLFVRKGLGGKPRLLLDPNHWSRDGTTALDAWKPSQDGRYLLYSVQHGGSDWRTLRVIDVASGKILPDEVRWAKFTQLGWVGSEGFLYSRFPQPPAGAAFQAPNFDQAVWFHRIGTSQDADELVFSTPDHPEYRHSADVTDDGRHVVITSSIGTDARHELRVIDLLRRKAEGWRAQPLMQGFRHDWKLVAGLGGTLCFVTNWDAPRYRLVAIDLGDRRPEWKELVAQGEETLQRAAIIGNKLLLSYLKDTGSKVLVHDLAGKPARAITLTDIGTASGFRGRAGDPETFYAFTSFNQPQAIYRMDMVTGATQPFAEPVLSFDPGSYDVDQVTFPSRDGTRVPMYVVRKKSIAAAGKPVPTLLYGYGGFDVAQTPVYSSQRMAWLEAGGAFALANLRGGGEFGDFWHEGGKRANKQNVFDDFIAAGEFLIARGIAPKGGLAAQGASNGGLVVAAAVNRRPDLFAAAVVQVGVLDMLRFDRFTSGRFWVDDYGRPDVAGDFKSLRAYSPYHNIRSGADYPAILVTTGDTDDRVVPSHSFKYVAALQNAQIGDRPHLLRVEAGAGHGAGKPTAKQIEEGADILAFLAQWTGLIPPGQPAP